MPKLKPIDRDEQRARREEVARKAEAGELILPAGSGRCAARSE